MHLKLLFKFNIRGKRTQGQESRSKYLNTQMSNKIHYSNENLEVDCKYTHYIHTRENVIFVYLHIIFIYLKL